MWKGFLPPPGWAAMALAMDALPGIDGGGTSPLGPPPLPHCPPWAPYGVQKPLQRDGGLQG